MPLLFGITSSLAPVPVEYLVVAGGGGGQVTGSGGGAGGMRSGSIDVYYGENNSVTIGAGGSGGAQGFAAGGTGGSNSVFKTITSTGGGAGTSHGGGNGQAGGSGSGGAAWFITGEGATTGGAGIAGQGNRGGNAIGWDGWGAMNAGGGGAGGQGIDIVSNLTDATGGLGLANSITGSSVLYAGGGAGGEVNSQRNALGGSGIGGNAQWEDIGLPGATNTGSGGGGGGYGGSQGRVSLELGGPYWRGGSGGSGIVIIAYLNTHPALSYIDPGLTYTQPTRSGYRVYRFTGGTGSVRF
jgi:hypothetical protein